MTNLKNTEPSGSVFYIKMFLTVVKIAKVSIINNIILKNLFTRTPPFDYIKKFGDICVFALKKYIKWYILYVT